MINFLRYRPTCKHQNRYDFFIGIYSVPYKYQNEAQNLFNVGSGRRVWPRHAQRLKKKNALGPITIPLKQGASGTGQ